jgi:hypothetical protein
MARTLAPTLPGELDGLGPVTDGESGFHYQFARTPDGSRHVLGELQKQDVTHAVGVEVLFGIGSGTRDRSYAVGHGAGVWFAPLEVLTRPTGRQAVLAPHAAMNPGSRFRVPITAECLGCHTNHLPPEVFPLNVRHDPRDWQPRGISCPACHGAAQAHARWQEADLEDEPLDHPDPVQFVNEFNRRQKMSLCAACHLQGDARIVLEKKALGPPAPGGDVLEARALFVAREPNHEVGFVSQVERLTRSACYLKSEMVCTTCHNPHRTLAEETERQRVRAACQVCHASRGAEEPSNARAEGSSAPACSNASMPSGSPSNDCATCHMPLVGVFDVAEVEIHDHYIRKDTRAAPKASHASNLRPAESATGDWKRFQWPDGGPPPTHLEDPGLWMMALASGGHEARARERVDEAPGETAAGLPMYHHVRAGLLESMGRRAEARRSYEKALALDPVLAVSAINLGLLLGQDGELQAGRQRLDAVLERHPLAVGALRNRAVLRGMEGDGPGALEDLERAFQAKPSAELARVLAGLCRSQGIPERAAQWDGLARQLK